MSRKRGLFARLRAGIAWVYHRKAQCEEDFAMLAGRAEEDVRRGRLIPELGSATYNYWGQILVNRNDRERARRAFQAAVRIAPESPGGMDAGRRLGQLK